MKIYFSGCAFIQFTKRSSAELAAEKTFNKLLIRGSKVTIRWGKSHGKTPSIATSSDLPIEMVPGHLPAPPIEVTKNYFGLAAPGPSGGFMNLPSSLQAAPLGIHNPGTMLQVLINYNVLQEEFSILARTLAEWELRPSNSSSSSIVVAGGVYKLHVVLIHSTRPSEGLEPHKV